MRKLSSAEAVNAAGKAALLTACIAYGGGDAALATPEAEGVDREVSSYLPPDFRVEEELYLEIFLNDVSTRMISGVKRHADGCLTIAAQDLATYKLNVPASAIHMTGRVCLDRLSGVAYHYDAPTQTLHLAVSEAAWMPHHFDVRERQREQAAETVVAKSEAPFGAVLNYSVYANFLTESFRTIPDYQGVSATLESMMFSSYGLLENSLVLRADATDEQPHLLRLNTVWSYEDPNTLRSYAAGDIISGGLNWTRPVRMGGIQVQRDFGLRPDLVTLPVPELAGSAAVPSTVEVYANQGRAFSQQITGGPFSVTNIPVVSGPGVMRLVIRDASGRETVTEYAYYNSSLLLAPGLYDYSLEAGFARTLFGLDSFSYDDDLIASGTLRYGVTPRLTLEAHAEGGAGLANLGAGAVFGLWHYGIGSLAGSVSHSGDGTGFQLAGSLETSLWGARLYARTLRSFDDYADLAFVTAPRKALSEIFGAETAARSGAPYRRQDQVSLSIPLGFDPGSFSLSYTDAEDAAENAYRLGTISYRRPFLWGSHLAVTAFNDFENDDSYGVFAGLNFTWDNVSTSVGANANARGVSAGADVSKSEGQEPGGYGWRARAREGAVSQYGASLSYRGEAMRLEGGVQQTGDVAQVTALAQGSVALMNGVHFSHRINDTFAVVDTGVPGVKVLHDNRPIGETDSAGRILVPSVRAHETNRIAIDPATLPVEADMPVTSKSVVPATRGGVTVRFKGDAAPPSALVSFRDTQGQFLPPGSEVWVNGSAEPFVIGYDGEAYITGLSETNAALVKTPDGSSCEAAFSFARGSQGQVRIPDVVCAS